MPKACAEQYIIPNDLATPERKRFREQNRSKMGSVPNYQ